TPDVEAPADSAPQSDHEIRELLVLEDLRGRDTLRVQDLPTQGENRLPGAITPLLRRPTRRIPFNDEQLAGGGTGMRAVRQLPRKVHAAGGGTLSHHLGLRRPARLPRTRREHNPRDDGLGDRL